LKAFILAAGKGERLGSLTETVPKPMLELAGKPILEYNILMCKKAGVHDIFINLHYLPNKISDYFGDGKKFGVNIQYNYENELLGTAGGILFFINNFKEEPYFVIYGDNYTEFDLLELKTYHESVNSDFTIALHWVDDISHSGVVQLGVNSEIVKFIEKPILDQIEGGWVNSGIYLINPKVIDDLVKQYSDFAKDIIPLALNREQKLYGYKIKNDLWAIDTPALFFSTVDKLNIN
jgi:NDP-sugar pyrophosphorylase family protein